MERMSVVLKNEIFRITAAVLLVHAALIGQQQPVVTRPATSSVQVAPRTATSPYASATNAATGIKVANGTVTGYVYWQMSGQSNAPNSCQGLAVTVSTISKVSPQTIGTANTLTATGPMTDGSSIGTPTYMLCSYSFQKMPEHLYLKVQVSAPTSQFSSAMANAVPFQINGGACNSTPQGTLSFILGGGEMLCGDNAYNINLKLTALAPAIARAPGPSSLLQNPGGPPHGLLSQSTQNVTANGATGSATGGGTLLHPGSSFSGVAANAKGPLLSNSKPSGAGGFTGGVKPSGTGGFTGGVEPQPVSGSISGNFVPKMPPMKSDPKRDASPLADVSTKAQIKSKLHAELLAAARPGRSANVALTPAKTVAPEIETLQRQKSFVDSLRTRGAFTKGSLVTAQAPNAILRSDPAGNSNPMLHAPPPNQICLNPEIRAVNGQTSGVTFTQDPAYNDYIITGCRFGSQTGQVYLSGAITGGRINFVVKQWSDTQIEAVVQPGLQGVLDGWPDLIVAPPSSATPVKFPNCRFYAQRQSVILPSIPQQYVTLANVTVGDGTHGFGTRYCPGPDLSHLFPCVAYNAGPPLDGITNGHDHRNDPSQLVSNAVDRDGGQDDFNSGEDVYDLSYMAPGFEVDYPDVFWYAWTSDVCEGWASDAFPKKPGDSVAYDTEGHYSFFKKTNTKIVVDWGVDHCKWRWLGIFKVDDWYNSGYSLQVHVKGPIGVDPWTGHPTSTGTKLGEKMPTRLVRMQ